MRTTEWKMDTRIHWSPRKHLISKKTSDLPSLTPSEKGYDTDYASTSKSPTSRLPLQSLFKGKILWKTNGSINENPFFKELNKKIINSSSSTVEQCDRKINRKSDIAIPQSNFSKIRSFKGNISFPYFPNHNVEVGQKCEKPRRQNKPRKLQPRIRHQIELGSSDNNKRTRVSRPSSKSTRRQPPQTKKVTTPTSYLASDECMIIPSDISDISDWEWIAGGFPCRDVAREWFISDSFKNLNQDGNTFNPRETNHNIIVEIWEDNFISDDKLSTQCPISIIPAQTKPTSQCPIWTTPAESSATTQVLDTMNNSTSPMEKDATMNFPVYEIVDSADEVISTAPTKPGNDSHIIRRSSRNVGPPKFYGKRYFKDVVDIPQVTSGSASNPILLDNSDSGKRDTNNRETPLEIVTIESDPTSPDQISSSSTDESLRIAVDN